MALPKALRASLLLGLLAAAAAFVRRALSSRSDGGQPDSEGIIR